MTRKVVIDLYVRVLAPLPLRGMKVGVGVLQLALAEKSIFQDISGHRDWLTGDIRKQMLERNLHKRNFQFIELSSQYTGHSVIHFGKHLESY